MRKTDLLTNRLPFEIFGKEHRRGWDQLSEKVLSTVEEYNKENFDKGSYITIGQVKEKWGRLEIYPHFTNVPAETVDKIWDMIKQVREESLNVCEECGTRENVGMTQNMWYTVTCLDCLKKDVAVAKEQGLDYKTQREWKRNSDGKIFIVTPEGVTEKE